jgi:hypothetical protein
MSIETPNINLTSEMKEELSIDGIASTDTKSRVSSTESESIGRKDSNVPDFLFSDGRDAEFDHDGYEHKDSGITAQTEEVPCESEDLSRFLLMFANEIRRSRGLADLPRLSYDMQLGLHVPDFVDNLIGSVDAYCFFNRNSEVYYETECETHQLEDLAIERSETSVIEPSESRIPRQWFCPNIDDEDLGPIAVDSHFMVDSDGCNGVNGATTEEAVPNQDAEVADESFCFESFYSVSESVFPLVKEKEQIFEYEFESSPICRSESIHSKTEGRLSPNSSVSISIDDNSPVSGMSPVEELYNEENHHVLDTRAKSHKKSRFNWIRRLFCFSA